MDLDLKMPPWDFAELEQGRNCLVDLMLGGSGRPRPPDQGKGKEVEMVSCLSSGSSKSTRALSIGSSPVASCLVDRCVSDLSKCRDYHRRHKVCEVHSKTPIVIVGGREQRFCQQCSRFHLLMEFDEVKRSCRKRLEGHNRRRRKPQPHSLSCGTYMTSHPGTRFTSYPQIFSTTTAKSNWPSIVKVEEVPPDTHFSPRHLINRHHNYDHFPVSSHGIFKDGKKFPFLQGNMQATPASAYQPLLRTISAVASPRSSGKLFDSDCAHSLLSSPEAHSSCAILSQDAATGDKIRMGQSLIPATQHGSLGRYYGSQASNTVSATGFSYSGMDREHVGPVLISDCNADSQCHGLFQVGGGWSSDGNSQTLSWQ